MPVTATDPVTTDYSVDVVGIFLNKHELNFCFVNIFCCIVITDGFTLYLRDLVMIPDVRQEVNKQITCMELV